MNVIETTSRTDFALPAWSAAEFLDTAYENGLMLRAVICRLGPGQWQWSVMTLANDRGELISTGMERSIANARQTAASEIEKCIQDPNTLD